MEEVTGSWDRGGGAPGGDHGQGPSLRADRPGSVVGGSSWRAGCPDPQSQGLAEGSDGWQYVPELVPAADEALVHKAYPDSFEDTTLESVLAAADVDFAAPAGSVG
ncbi:isochorismatase family protein [Nocardioides sp. KIGAM211]|uniref:Isochorismatase family protein n=1 Tax=Nocardioides luti TaxID=2761101 RepID=A0A7X0VAG6_9ACTN|nr:isochorismatase family protein [Nocardioides luti]